MLLVALIGFFLFFLIEVFWPNELLLTLLAGLMIGVILFLGPTKAEIILLLIGITFGLLIEVGLGKINRLQHWENASFFGVPYWLPLMWGFGFVMIYNLGQFLQDRF